MNATQISFPRNLLPDAAGLVLEDAYFAHGEMVVVLRSEAPTASCPSCGSASASIHSYYQRARPICPGAVIP